MDGTGGAGCGGTAWENAGPDPVAQARSGPGSPLLLLRFADFLEPDLNQSEIDDPGHESERQVLEIKRQGEGGIPDHVQAHGQQKDPHEPRLAHHLKAEGFRASHTPQRSADHGGPDHMEPQHAQQPPQGNDVQHGLLPITQAGQERVARRFERREPRPNGRPEQETVERPAVLEVVHHQQQGRRLADFLHDAGAHRAEPTAEVRPLEQEERQDERNHPAQQHQLDDLVERDVAHHVHLEEENQHGDRNQKRAGHDEARNKLRVVELLHREHEGQVHHDREGERFEEHPGLGPVGLDLAQRRGRGRRADRKVFLHLLVGPRPEDLGEHVPRAEPFDALDARDRTDAPAEVVEPAVEAHAGLGAAVSALPGGPADPNLLLREQQRLLNSMSIDEDDRCLNRLATGMEAIRPEPSMPLGDLGIVAQHVALRRLAQQQRLGPDGEPFAAIRSGNTNE